MNKKHIITISGKPGSGKSSTADSSAELLGYARHSCGDTVRKFISENKMTLTEYNQRAAIDHSLDEKIDEQLRNLRDQNDIVVDSRLGFYWIPESFKVYLDLDVEEATKRIWTDATSNVRRKEAGEGTNDIEALTLQIKERIEQEQTRFQAMYNVDPYNLEHFDLVIDTERQSPKTVALTVVETYTRWLKSDTWKQENSALSANYTLEE